MRGRPPFFLRLRSSTPFIAVTVGLGGESGPLGFLPVKALNRLRLSVVTDLSGYGLVRPPRPARGPRPGHFADRGPLRTDRSCGAVPLARSRLLERGIENGMARRGVRGRPHRLFAAGRLGGEPVQRPANAVALCAVFYGWSCDPVHGDSILHRDDHLAHTPVGPFAAGSGVTRSIADPHITQGNLWNWTLDSRTRLGDRFGARRARWYGYGVLDAATCLEIRLTRHTLQGQVMVGFSVGSLIGPPVGTLHDSQRRALAEPNIDRQVECFTLAWGTGHPSYSRCVSVSLLQQEKKGYSSPAGQSSVFCDFVLRLLVIEKHVALKWIRAGVEIPGFEAPGYTPTSSDPKSDDSLSSPSPIPLKTAATAAEQEEPDTFTTLPSAWSALLTMVTSARPVTNFALTVLNGIILGGMLGTPAQAPALGLLC